MGRRPSGRPDPEPGKTPPAAMFGRNILILRPCASDFRRTAAAARGNSLMADRSPFWARQAHADRRPFLLARARIVAALRGWFAARDFVEVETAALQVSPGNETHLHAFATDLISPAGASARRYLRTSPEFACKKLLSAGEPRIVEFARVFRNRERGALHAPEFTMLEWYRAQAPYETLMEDCARDHRAWPPQAAGTARLAFRGREIDPFAAPEYLTVARGLCALCRHRSDGELVAARSRPGRALRRPPPRPASGSPTTTIGATSSAVCWWSASSRGSASAAPPCSMNIPPRSRPWRGRKPSDPRVAERFELYACGVELANGFGELTDPVEQRRRLAAEMAEKERIYGERYPLDEDFLAALAQMPPASGVALGLDRLVMLATGAPHIDHVMWTPAAEP